MSSSLSQPQPSDSNKPSNVQSIGVQPTAAPKTNSGWTIFAATMLIVAGVLNLWNGLTLLNHSSYFVNRLLYGDLTTWGWVFLVWGVLQAVAGAMSYGKNAMVGPAIGVCLAAIAVFIWFFMIFAAPAAAILGVAINALIIYGLSLKLAAEEQ